jgi:hypothetical protein
MQDYMKKIKIKQSLKGLKNIQVDIQNQEDKREEERASLADFSKYLLNKGFF